MRILAAALLLVWGSLAGCAADPLAGWSRGDRVLLVTNVTCQVTDYRQTEWALEHGYKEANPLLGSSPSDETLVGAKIAAVGVTWWASRDPEYRTVALLALTLPCLAVIAHNYSEGARP